MTENDIKSMGLVLSLDRCIEIAHNICESSKDKLKYVRSIASKKACKNAIEFWEATSYHLKRLKQIESENQK